MELVTMVLACSLYPDNNLTNAILQVGSKNNPYVVTVDGSPAKTFTSAAAAAQFANDQMQQGRDFSLGLMQIPSRWLIPNKPIPADLFMPCKNMTLATKVLSSAVTYCYQQPNVSASDDVRACTLSTYKSGDAKSGADYANTIMAYASAHPFSAIQAKAEAANPKGFHMIPGDAATYASTQNASKVNPATDPEKVKKKVVVAEDDADTTVASNTTDTTNTADTTTSQDN